MPDKYGTEEMFPLPEKYRRSPRTIKYPKWSKYSGKRISCDDCTLAISKGKSVFLAEPAKHVREDDSGKRYYCYRHTTERREGEAS